jgi:hypothetical protein
VAVVSVTAVLLFVFKHRIDAHSIFGYLEVSCERHISFNSEPLSHSFWSSCHIHVVIASRKRETNPCSTPSLYACFIDRVFQPDHAPIRANAGTPINENNPNDARALLAYYNGSNTHRLHFYGELLQIFMPPGSRRSLHRWKSKYERNLETGKYVVKPIWKCGKIQWCT